MTCSKYACVRANMPTVLHTHSQFTSRINAVSRFLKQNPVVRFHSSWRGLSPLAQHPTSCRCRSWRCWCRFGRCSPGCGTSDAPSYGSHDSGPGNCCSRLLCCALVSNYGASAAFTGLASLTRTTTRPGCRSRRGCSGAGCSRRTSNFCCCSGSVGRGAGFRSCSDFSGPPGTRSLGLFHHAGKDTGSGCA
jgi:hypothetical protein